MWEAVGDRWDMEVELCSLYVSCSGETCTLFKLGMLDKVLYVFMQHTVKDLPPLISPTYALGLLLMVRPSVKSIVIF